MRAEIDVEAIGFAKDVGSQLMEGEEDLDVNQTTSC